MPLKSDLRAKSSGMNQAPSKGIEKAPSKAIVHDSSFADDDNYIDILQQIEEDDPFGAVEHQLTMILGDCKLDIQWITDNWQSVVFVCQQPYSKVCVLNHFETII